MHDVVGHWRRTNLIFAPRVDHRQPAGLTSEQAKAIRACSLCARIQAGGRGNDFH